MPQQIFSITQINEYLRNQMDGDPTLCQLAVRGEISNYKMYPSGHHYFTLKDENAALKCVMFKGNAIRLRFRPENGMQVIAMGRITVYPRDGAFQLYCTAMALDGVGDLYAAFEQCKKRLAAQGLFDPAHKKPLPRYPGVIGIITSSAGAAIHDMLRILRKRYPLTEIRLFPVRVQGTEAPGEIAAAIRYANHYGLADLLIVGRGGGSIEDLWAFNEEIVARAIFECQVPVISAVGHETDWTIADFVSDLRAPTPSAAAELAVPDRAEQGRKLCTLEENIHNCIQFKLSLCYNRLEQTEQLLSRAGVQAALEERAARLDTLAGRLQTAARGKLQAGELRLKHTAALAASLNPYGVLARGYAMVQDNRGRICTPDALRPGQTCKLRGTEHRVTCTVNTVEELDESTQKL